jgi:multiple sugar transport system ATP-binding protein
MAGVALSAIVKRFGALEVIRNVSIEVADGEFCVFVGPSGCGKSTLLRIIAGLEGFDTGDVKIGGRRVNELPARARDIAMVFQDYALYPHMTVWDNMAFALRMRDLARDEIERRVRDAARTLQIEHLLDRKPRQLSGGQRQRVAMGRAIVRQPQVFLFDEPLSNLDAKLRVDMRTEIKRLHRQIGATMIYVTHDQVEAMTLADRVVVLRDGVIEQVGAPRDVYDRPVSRFVAGFIGSPSMNFVPARLEGGAVLLPDGQRLAWPGPRNGASEVVLGIRPEHFLENADGASATLAAEVDVVEPMGSDTLVALRVDSQQIVARLSAHAAVEPGQRLRLGVAIERAHLFDPQSGRALR